MTKSSARRAKLKLAILAIDRIIPTVRLWCHAEEYLPPPFDKLCPPRSGRPGQKRAGTSARKRRVR